jgi:hypothetical protein
MAGNQHTTKKAPLFAPIPLDGKKLTGTANPNYSGKTVAPAAPLSAPGYSTPGSAGLKPVPPAAK